MTFGAAFVSGLLETALRAFLLALVAWAGLRLFRVKSASAEHAVWTLVAIGMILLALRPVLPPIRARILPALPAYAIAEPSEDASVDTPVTSHRVKPTGSTVPLYTSRNAMTQDHGPRISGAPVIYAAGVGLFLIQFAGGFWLLVRLRRNCRLIRNMDGVPVYECGAISVPVAIGCFRPRILLPVSWHEWHAEKLEAALVHERTHIRRADWAISVVAALNRCVFWFHPLAWWLERRLALLAEEACDDATVLALGDRAQYAQTLLDMARAVTFRRGRFSFATMNMAGHRRMRERIDRVLDETREIGALLTRRTWAVALSAALPLLYLWTAFQPARMVAQIPTRHVVKPASDKPSAPETDDITLSGITGNVSLTDLVASSLETLSDAAFQPARNTTQAPPSLFRQAEANALARRASGLRNETTEVEMLAAFYSSVLVRGFAGMPGPYSSPDDLHEAQASLESSSDGWLLERTAAMLIESGDRVGAPANVRIDWQRYPNLSAAVAYGLHLMKRAQQLGEGGGGLGAAPPAIPVNSPYSCEAPKDVSDFYFLTAKPSSRRVELLHDALVSDPDNVFLNRWLVMSTGGDFRQEYRQKLSAHPNDPAYLFYYAQAIMTAGWDPASALPYLEQSIALAPGFPWSYELLAHIHSIGAWADQGNLVQDIRTFSNVCPQFPDNGVQLPRVHDATALRELTARYRRAVESRGASGIGNYYPSLWSSELRLTPAAQYTEYANQVATDLSRLRQLGGIDPNAMADGEALLAALEH